ncbi:hypothetical protein O1M54_44910 [Streptomyces diastatochromogenes]|nr:hypothetical protein [Streptomyces diastatochromogenes]
MPGDLGGGVLQIGRDPYPPAAGGHVRAPHRLDEGERAHGDEQDPEAALPSGMLRFSRPSRRVAWRP